MVKKFVERKRPYKTSISNSLNSGRKKNGVDIFQYINDMDKSEKQKWIIVIIILTLGIGATLLNEYVG